MSLRRGPTLRGDRYVRRHSSDDEEERIGLTNDIDETEVIHNEKFETDEAGKPLYHHGDETFGDLLTHPIEELHAHQQRKQDFQTRLRDAPNQTNNNPTSGQPINNQQYSLVLHFRQLRGNQSFVLDHDSAEDFCSRLNFTLQEKIQFNGVHDTEGLTEFLYKIKKDFSIKLHHKTDHLKEEHHHHDAPENHTIEFNSNFYVEFKPKHTHSEVIPPEVSRRPFFRHPEPDLSADIGLEKAASWLELFYDLFYVASLSQFTHSHHIYDWSALGIYAQWFVITWWAWCASSLYTARFDTDDVVHHIYKLVEMCAVIGMAGSSEHFLNSPGYVYGYIGLALKAVLVVEYAVVLVVAILAKSKSRIALAFYVGANLLSIALWASSLVILDRGIHRILWYMGVLCELLVNVIVRGDKRLSWAASHLAERLGLLTLIVLGENLIGLTSLVSENAEGGVVIVVPNFMAVVIIFGFFFMYFEDFNKEIFLHNKYHQIWVYLHFPLHLCQVAFGISLIDILTIYRHQLVRDGKIPGETSTEGEIHAPANETSAETTHGSPTGTTEHGATTSTNTEHGAASSSSTTEHEAATPQTGHEKVKRDILHTLSQMNTQPLDEDEYNPMRMMIDEQEQQKAPLPRKNWTQVCQTLLSTVMVGTLQILHSSTSTIGEQEEYHHPHLMRRSPSESSSSSSHEQEGMTDPQLNFVYKTFLIFAGLILIVNSLIKALNTKISDTFGKIIISARLINAIVLWSLCALPFAQLDAIVLLSTLVGSLVFQGLVDLLD